MAQITKPQVDTIVTTLQNAHIAFTQLEQFAGIVQQFMANNWVSTVTIGSVGSTLKVNSSVSVSDQNALISQYQTLKTNLTTIINQLP
jgi:hypothetical protein